jgi:hypothetical protein
VKVNRFIAFPVAVGLLVASSPIFAHHGTAGYNMEKTITLNGTITSFNWGNPHCVLIWT